MTTTTTIGSVSWWTWTLDVDVDVDDFVIVAGNVVVVVDESASEAAAVRPSACGLNR